MRHVFAILGILSMAAGTFCGVANWGLSEFYMETVEWQGPMVTVNSALWVLGILGMGIGGVLIGIAAMIEPTGKS